MSNIIVLMLFSFLIIKEGNDGNEQTLEHLHPIGSGDTELSGKYSMFAPSVPLIRNYS